MSITKFDVRYKSLLEKGYKSIDISNKDLDDMKYSGIFYGFNLENAPDANYTQVIITRHNENWIVQECKDYIDTVYLRSYKDGKWSNWTELVAVPSCDQPDKEYIIVERPHTHALATPQTEGFMSASDKAKLDAFNIDVEDGSFVLPDHSHEEYEQALRIFEERMAALEEVQFVMEDADKRYLPAYSANKPTHHNIAGQVWIDLQD